MQQGGFESCLPAIGTTELGWGVRGGLKEPRREDACQRSEVEKSMRGRWWWGPAERFERRSRRCSEGY